MRIPVRQVLVTLALFLFVTVLVFGGLWYQQCNCQPYLDAKGDYHPVVGNLICDTVANPEAIFALALVVCTIVSFGFISTQIAQTNRAIAIAQQANDFAEVGIGLANEAIFQAKESNKVALRAAEAAERANKQTTRSIDLTINAERGRLEYLEGFRSPKGRQIHYRFKNVGRSPLTILQFNASFKIIAASAQYPDPIHQYPKIGVLNHTLDSNAVLSTWTDSKFAATPIAGLWTEIEDIDNLHLVGMSHVVFAQFRFRYRTMVGIDYIFRTAIVYDGSTVAHSLNRAYEEDTPHMFMGILPSDVIGFGLDP